MKINTVIIVLCVAFSAGATGQTSPSAIAPTNAIVANETAPATNEIVTFAGAIYEKVRIEKVEPDGLTISYIPAGGGIGATKIPFDELSTNIQATYGYDFNKAAKYREEHQKAMGQWREQLIADEAAAKAKREAEEKAAEEAEAAQKAAEEAAAQATNSIPTNSIPTNAVPPPPQGGGY